MPPSDDDIGRLFADLLHHNDSVASPCDVELIWRAGRRERRTRLALAGSGTAMCFAAVGAAIALTIPGRSTPLAPPAAVASSALPSPSFGIATTSTLPEIGTTSSGCGGTDSSTYSSRLPILPACVVEPVGVPYVPPSTLGVLGPSASPS